MKRKPASLQKNYYVPEEKIKPYHVLITKYIQLLNVMFKYVAVKSTLFNRK